jgi:hypothetical protein
MRSLFFSGAANVRDRSDEEEAVGGSDGRFLHLEPGIFTKANPIPPLRACAIKWRSDELTSLSSRTSG